MKDEYLNECKTSLSEAEEKQQAFHLLISYGAFEKMILSNYPFQEQWIFDYFERNRNLDISEQVWFFNQNENLKLDWKQIYDLERKYAGHWGISHNKSACESLRSFGIEINFSQNPYPSRPPKEFVLNKCTFDDLSGWLRNNQTVEREYFFESKDIWDRFFKKHVDEEMINAWTYADTLTKETWRISQEISNRREQDVLERENDFQKMARGEYDGYGKNDDIIDEAFEGDSDYLWNID